MQAHKVTLTIVDLDEIGAEEIKVVIENVHYPNRCISPEVVSIETAEIGEWSDDHPLNNNKTAPAEWQRLFPALGGLTKRAVDVCPACGGDGFEKSYPVQGTCQYCNGTGKRN